MVQLYAPNVSAHLCTRPDTIAGIDFFSLNMYINGLWSVCNSIFYRKVLVVLTDTKDDSQGFLLKLGIFLFRFSESTRCKRDWTFIPFGIRCDRMAPIPYGELRHLKESVAMNRQSVLRHKMTVGGP